MKLSSAAARVACSCPGSSSLAPGTTHSSPRSGKLHRPGGSRTSAPAGGALHRPWHRGRGDSSNRRSGHAGRDRARRLCATHGLHQCPQPHAHRPGGDLWPCPCRHPVRRHPRAVAYFVRMLPAAIRNWSRNHAWSASGVSRGCQAMKYEKPLISCGGSTIRTSAVAAAIFASLRGTVRTRSLRATVKIVGTKNGRRSPARLLKPRSAKGLVHRRLLTSPRLHDGVRKVEIFFQRETSGADLLSSADQA